METTEVVIAGGGPTGLMLAAELRLAGVDVVLLDGLPARTGESRAGGIHARTMEIFDQRGLLDDLLAQGRALPGGHFGALHLDFGDFHTRYPFMLAVLQSVVERELDRRATELGAPVRWGSPVTGFRQDAAGIDVEVGGPDRTHTIRAAYLVGCDGGRSAVRKLAGIAFPGTEATATGMLADVELATPPETQFFGRRRGAGDYSVVQFEPGWYRLVVQRHDLVMPRGSTLTFEEFRANYAEIAGTDFGMHSPRWVTHYGDAARQAEHYRNGRVFLAGDAAHIHYPAGGQGQNLSVQDAVNLGWKLAIALRTNSSEVLDTYESERHPVGTRVLNNTRAQTALQRPGAHMEALREVMGDLIEMDAVRRRLGLMITGLDIRYDTKGDHPLAGRRVPDGDLSTDEGDTRVFELLRLAHPILLRLNGNQVPLPSGWQDRIDVIDARSRDDHWAVPAVGDIAVPAAILIRPDGYTAWVTDEPGDEGLTEALTTWFGPAS
ncbi:FAD-dependent monooxygenase [Nocardia sp. NPDC057030]|uniref:FAD-dependent monooxygenase n=1 Tax=unclassified Nocardia TaxID=2637762 RepID=UPI00363E3DFA